MGRRAVLLLALMISILAPGCEENWFDFTPPKVTGSRPGNDERGVAETTNIEVTFSEEMNKETAQAAFSLSPGGEGLFTWKGKTLVFDPDEDLEPGTTYTIAVGTAAEDRAGNGLEEVYIAQFVVGADTTPPTVLTTTPADGDIGVDEKANIRVEFSEAMNETKAQEAFSLSPSTTGMYTWEGNVLQFDPDGELQHGTTYTLTVSATAEDLAGNPMEENYVAQFVVGADFAPPQVLGVNHDGSADYWPDGTVIGPANIVPTAPTNDVRTPIVVTFSESMNRSKTKGAFSASGDPEGDFSWNGEGTQMTFTPAEDWPDGRITITIGQSAEDAEGNVLEEEYSMYFVVEGSSPRVLTIGDDSDGTPDQNIDNVWSAQNVAMNSAGNFIVVVFSEAMDQAAVQSAVSFSSISATETVYVLSFQWSAAKDILVIDVETTPGSGALSSVEWYSLTIDTGAKDSNDNPMAEDYIHFFKAP
ncbi:MAG: Ig-like domain-containing protein [bacterium]